MGRLIIRTSILDSIAHLCAGRELPKAHPPVAGHIDHIEIHDRSLRPVLALKVPVLLAAPSPDEHRLHGGNPRIIAHGILRRRAGSEHKHGEDEEELLHGEKKRREHSIGSRGLRVEDPASTFCHVVCLPYRNF